MTVPVAPDAEVAALANIAAAIEAVAFQIETATLMAYLSMPYRGAALQPIAARLGQPDPLAETL